MTRVVELFRGHRGRWLVTDQRGQVVGDYATEPEALADITAGAVSLPADSPHFEQ